MKRIANGLMYTPLVFALLLFILTANLFFKSYNLKTKGTKVQGIVIAISNENSAMYSSIVEFKTKTGEKITFTGGEPSNPVTYGKGEAVEVLYYENTPKNAKINDWSSLYLTTTFAGVWTLIFAFMGIVVLKVVSFSGFANKKNKKYQTFFKTFRSKKRETYSQFDGSEKEWIEKKQKELANPFSGEKKYPIEIILPLTIGTICLIFAYFSYTNVKKDLANSIKVEAVVLEYSIHPFVGFKTLDGREIKYRSSVSTKPPMYKKGEVIEVYYDKDYPDKVRIRNFWNLWFLTTFLEVFGGIWFLAGVGFWKSRYNRRMNKKALYLTKE